MLHPQRAGDLLESLEALQIIEPFLADLEVADPLYIAQAAEAFEAVTTVIDDEGADLDEVRQRLQVALPRLKRLAHLEVVFSRQRRAARLLDLE